MRDKDLSNIRQKREELKRLGGIRSRYHNPLEERLELICHSYERRPRSDRGRQKDASSYSRDKRASRIYTTILDENPNAILPFLIAISPRACRSFNVDAYCTEHIDENKIILTEKTRTLLEDMGARRHICDHTHFGKFMTILFPTQTATISRPCPITTADSESHWAYDVADMVAFRTIFGVQSYTGVESHPRRIAEKENTGAPLQQQSTQLVKARLPQGNYHDGVFWVHTGQVIEAIRVLFPSTYQRISWLFETKSTLHDIGLSRDNAVMADPREKCMAVDAHFLIEWASVPGIRIFFNSPVYDAIDGSHLRDWEKEQQILDLTNCVTMEVRIVRGQLPIGILRLRMEFRLSTQIARSMYSFQYP